MWSDYREKLVARNPRLSNKEERLTIKAGELLRILKRAYDAGWVSGSQSNLGTPDEVECLEKLFVWK